MKTIRSTYPVIIPLLAFASCAQEEMIRNGNTGEDDIIVFRASLPSLSLTRGDANVGNLSNGIHLTAFTLENSTTDGSDNTLVGGDGKLQEHFAKTIGGSDNVFTAPDCRWPKNRGEKEGKLEFFAFYPPLPESGTSTLVNRSNVIGDVTTIDYELASFRIAKDISEQVDFVTAHTTGSKTENHFSGVNLDFQHQLSRVELLAWGNNSNYDVEIAGVRIGGVVVKADFNFTGKSSNPSDNPAGVWKIDASPERDCVEYIFREGDKVVSINEDQHNTEENAASIMGKGGAGMVIPSETASWDKSEDKPNTQKGAYFSVLLRVTDKATGKLLYPYPAESYEDMPVVVCLSVKEDNGEVMKRLYKKGNSYYTDAECQQLYTLEDDREIREYVWASVPYETAWEAGFKYTYILDYSNGVGIHDPIHPNPGTPILNTVTISSSITPWNEQAIDSEATSE